MLRKVWDTVMGVRVKTGTLRDEDRWEEEEAEEHDGREGCGNP
jgi:hypothetical protein